MLELVWKLIKVWAGKIFEFLLKLLKAQIKAVIFKYGLMLFMIIFTFILAVVVLR